MEILLVESNLGDICLIKEAIKETAKSCNLTSINDGSKAISYISDFSVKIDLIILSTNIIKENAFEILEVCSRNLLLRNIPIFIFGDCEEYENECKKISGSGAIHFCDKPFDTAEYFKVVESFINSGSYSGD